MDAVSTYDPRSRDRDAPPVIVVGAGTSGCACAVTLAESGVPVVLVDGALDNVGLPSYGPVVWLDDEPADGSVPGSLWRAWTRYAWRPEEDLPLLVVDRRAVSLEVKRVVESYDLVALRQGLVTAVRPLTGARFGSVRVEVETAFGEIFHGAACVIAVGLALRGRVRAGVQTLAGGRYGELAADELADCLEIQGAALSTVERSVGVRVAGRAEEVLIGAAPVRLVATGVKGDSDAAVPRVEGLTPGETATRPGGEVRVMPSAPHEDQSLHPSAFLVGRARPGASAGTCEDAGTHERGLLIVPDSVATREWYVAAARWGGDEPPGLGFRRTGTGAKRGAITRPPHTVVGAVVVGVEEDGSLRALPGVWVGGQASGATEYLESLRSGARVGRAIAAWLGNVAQMGGAA